jgi:hypothetical protein
MSYAVNIPLPDAVRGDVYPPSPDGSGMIIIGPILIDGSQPAATLSRVEMRFKKGTRELVLDSATGEITITNATTWEAEIASQSSFLTIAGDWDWDMAFYPTGETAPLTFYTGVLTVLSDV